MTDAQSTIIFFMYLIIVMPLVSHHTIYNLMMMRVLPKYAALWCLFGSSVCSYAVINNPQWFLDIPKHTFRYAAYYFLALAIFGFVSALYVTLTTRIPETAKYFLVGIFSNLVAMLLPAASEAFPSAAAVFGVVRYLLIGIGIVGIVAGLYETYARAKNGKSK